MKIGVLIDSLHAAAATILTFLQLWESLMGNWKTKRKTEI